MSKLPIPPATTNCPIHGRPLECLACRSAEAGSRKSLRKAKASRRNGRLGGRPKKRNSPSPTQTKGAAERQFFLDSHAVTSEGILTQLKRGEKPMSRENLPSVLPANSLYFRRVLKPSEILLIEKGGFEVIPRSGA